MTTRPTMQRHVASPIVSSTLRGVAVAVLYCATWASTVACGPPAGAEAPDQPAALRIEHERVELDNGLTVIVHEDHRQPRVVVALSYQVGSRDEPVGRTGFAHLFEHLMFMGTERVPLGEFDGWLEREGGRGNAWTSEDRTFFYDVGPSHLLELLLWMEADRFSALGEQLSQTKLEMQRKVVLNERRSEIENVPYGKEELRLPGLVFPKGHPYAHPIIGATADVEAAAVADVRTFFALHYRPDNAALVIAGDVETSQAVQLARRHFGAISPLGGQPPRAAPPAARIDRTVRATLEDSVTLPKLTMAWLSPAAYAEGDAELDLLAAVIAKGKTSRLYQALVHEQRLAASVDARQHSRMLQSLFTIEALARPGVSLDTLERALDRELAELRRKPIGARELARARLHYETTFVARLQSLEERASLLASYWAHRDDPGFVAEDLGRYRKSTAAGVQRTITEILVPTRRVVLRTVPVAGARTSTQGDSP